MIPKNYFLLLSLAFLSISTKLFTCPFSFNNNTENPVLILDNYNKQLVYLAPGTQEGIDSAISGWWKLVYNEKLEIYVKKENKFREGYQLTVRSCAGDNQARTFNLSDILTKNPTNTEVKKHFKIKSLKISVLKTAEKLAPAAAQLTTAKPEIEKPEEKAVAEAERAALAATTEVVTPVTEATSTSATSTALAPLPQIPTEETALATSSVATTEEIAPAPTGATNTTLNTAEVEAPSIVSSPEAAEINATSAIATSVKAIQAEKVTSAPSGAPTINLNTAEAATPTAISSPSIESAEMIVTTPAEATSETAVSMANTNNISAETTATASTAL